MAEWCVKAGSRPGDAVLDPFAGAGTTLLAANRLGRDAVGVELNAAYAALAEARIAAGTAPEPKPSRSSRRARVPPPAPSLFDALLAAE
jgi:DNA modification methylase